MQALNPKEWILANQEALFELVLGIKLSNKLILSPFRVETKPSCGFYYSKTGRLYLHDFGSEEHFDIFEIIKRKHNCGYHKAITILLGYADSVTETEKLQKEEQEVTYILHDSYGNYFDQYKISEKTLKLYNVHPVKVVFVNDNIYWRATSKNPIFAYRFPSGGFKLYRPLSPDTTKKWKNVCDGYDVQGYLQLPARSSLVIITSSLKDVMVLRELGFNAIAFNSEGIPKKDGEGKKHIQSVITDLKERFDTVITFMDNDEAGKKAKAILEEHYGLSGILIPDNFPKDISDYIKKYNRNKTLRLLKKLITKCIRQSTEDFLNFVNNDLSTETGRSKTSNTRMD